MGIEVRIFQSHVNDLDISSMMEKSKIRSYRLDTVAPSPVHALDSVYSEN